MRLSLLLAVQEQTLLREIAASRKKAKGTAGDILKEQREGQHYACPYDNDTA